MANLFPAPLHQLGEFRVRSRHRITAPATWAISLAIAVALGPLAKSADATKPPNIILILTDDQGYGDIGRHGNTVIKTPHLDRLHDESVRFLDHYVSPTCSPTRSSIMTGRHEFKNGITHTINERERMTLKATTIAQVLKSGGYTTGIFGKWHLGDEDAHQPEKRGFDEVYIHGAGGIGQAYPGSCGDAPKNSYFGPWVLHNQKFEKSEEYCTDAFFHQAEKWMDTVKGTKPFFAYITPNAPHAPLNVPEKYETMYQGQPANVAKFFGMVTNIDENVGELLQKLKGWGIENDTLVIYMNDNGGTAGVSVFNDGMKAQKGSPHRGGTRGMAFFRWPGTLKPAAVDKLTAHLDVFPTLAEIAGAKVPDGIAPDGYSLVPLLKGASTSWPDRTIVSHVGRWAQDKASVSQFANCAIRQGQYTLVSTVLNQKRKLDGKAEPTAGQTPRWELYDLKADPGEKTNLATAKPEVVKAMAANYDKWWAEVQPLLVNEDGYKFAPKVNPFVERFQKQFPAK